ncbi:DNA polymerase [Flammeovirga agarivorans]|uniref:DNA polymerase I n=1 Tax=Flammeovirga agarivorans TaxID=2726742 RepID=A0A7X8SRJ3_9BACT|nr:DNA polymerase [Flammeovirga agarivorans]NLR94927.1 hypothetical protein [Flammeovirga agarivorans]
MMRRQVIKKRTQLEKFAKEVDLSQDLGFDTETLGTKIDRLQITSLQFHDRENKVSWSILTKESTFGEITLRDLKEVLNPILPKMKIVGQNLKFDLWVLKVNGLSDPILKDDTLILIYLADATIFTKALKERLHKDLSVPKTHIWGLDEKCTERSNEVFGLGIGSKGKPRSKKISWDFITTNWKAVTRPCPRYDLVVEKYGKTTLTDFWNNFLELSEDEEVCDIPLITEEIFIDYGLNDVEYILPLRDFWLAKLSPKQVKLYEEIELPFLKILVKALDKGAYIDRQLLENTGKKVKESLDKIEVQIYNLTGIHFNIGSSDQLAEVLYQRLGFPILARTDKGKPSTKASVLKDLNKTHPHKLLDLLLQRADLAALWSKFYSKLPDHIVNDKIHCQFNQAIVETGRLSSSDPNLQQVVNHKEYPVRDAFVPRPGYAMVVYDFSQVEPRILTHASGDPFLTEIYQNDRDIYQEIADEIGIKRSESKTLVLAIMYGMGAKSVSETLGITELEAKNYLNNFLAKMPSISKTRKSVEDAAKAAGFAEDMFGRRRPLNFHNKEDKNRALRQSFNFLIQGSASSVFKLSTIKVEEVMKKYNGFMTMFVHDEIIAEVPIKDVWKASLEMKEAMESTIALSVPLKSDGGVVKNWGDGKREITLSKQEVEELMTPKLSIQEIINLSLGYQCLN